MPNHVKNILTIEGSEEDINKVFEFIKSDEEYFAKNERSIDFAKITPIPKWVYGSDPSVNGISMEDERKYGRDNCIIGWRYDNWNTKWNAYDQEYNPDNPNTIIFNTAWRPVTNLIEKIAWMFPNVIISYSYSDEDLGYNLGEIRLKDTNILSRNIPQSGSKQAYQLAFKIRGIDRPEHTCMVYNPDIDNYVYDEYLDYYYDRPEFRFPITFINEFRDDSGKIPPVIFVK